MSDTDFGRKDLFKASLLSPMSGDQCICSWLNAEYKLRWNMLYVMYMGISTKEVATSFTLSVAAKLVKEVAAST